MMSYDETVIAMSNAAAVVKLICGVANNAAWMVMLDALDHAKQCPSYRHEVKRNFHAAMKAMKDYEARLIHNRENRMFHLADMSETVRKKYGNITDREYYDFWASMGGVAYTKTKPLINSLWNKYRLSLVREGVDHADHVAWVMTAMAAVELAVQMYRRAVKECVNGYGLPKQLVEHVFGQFCLQEVSKLWRKALVSLCPGTDSIEPQGIDQRNIELGLQQLCEAWASPTLLYDSTMDTVDDFGEIFRTKGEQKKALKNIADVRDETEEEIKKLGVK